MLLPCTLTGLVCPSGPLRACGCPLRHLGWVPPSDPGEKTLDPVVCDGDKSNHYVKMCLVTRSRGRSWTHSILWRSESGSISPFSKGKNEPHSRLSQVFRARGNTLQGSSLSDQSIDVASQELGKTMVITREEWMLRSSRMGLEWKGQEHRTALKPSGPIFQLSQDLWPSLPLPTHWPYAHSWGGGAGLEVSAGPSCISAPASGVFPRVRCV